MKKKKPFLWLLLALILLLALGVALFVMGVRTGASPMYARV